MFIRLLSSCDIAPGNLLAPLPAAWECDLATGTLRWSAGVYELFGLARDVPITREQALGLYTEESRALLEQLRNDAIAQAGSFTFDAEIRRPDGSMRQMRITADVECEAGVPVRLYGTKQDISDEAPIR